MRFALPLELLPEVPFARDEPPVRFADDALDEDVFLRPLLVLPAPFARFPAALVERADVFFAEEVDRLLVLPPVFFAEDVFFADEPDLFFAPLILPDAFLVPVDFPPDLADDVFDLADAREALDLRPPVPERLPPDDFRPPVAPAPVEPPGLGITLSAAAAIPPIAAPAAAPPSISPAASITLSRMPFRPDLFECEDLFDDDDPPPDELELSAMMFLPLIDFREPMFNSKLPY